MKERPILFSGPMVKAILEGRKTQTRRVVNSAHALGDLDPYFGGGTCEDCDACFYTPEKTGTRICLACPYGQPGDRLWVRETFFVELPSDQAFEVEGLPLSHWKPRQIEEALYHYRATPDVRNPNDWVWRPSIYMPRWASRLTLEIVSVRVERLQDISEEDAIAEGGVYTDTGNNRWGQRANGWSHRGNTTADTCLLTAKFSFWNLWDSINGPGSWDANPWVWVVEFKQVQS